MCVCVCDVILLAHKSFLLPSLFFPDIGLAHEASLCRHSSVLRSNDVSAFPESETATLASGHVFRVRKGSAQDSLQQLRFRLLIDNGMLYLCLRSTCAEV